MAGLKVVNFSFGSFITIIVQSPYFILFIAL